MMNGDPLDELDEQAAEIARLRSQPCPYVVGRTTLHCSLTPFTLTDAERAAIAEAVGAYNDNDDDEECARIAATLHGLLKRTERHS
jgi:hypothetical protein